MPFVFSGTLIVQGQGIAQVRSTGIHTVNRMSIRKLAVNETVHDVEQQAAQALPEEFHEIVEFGILASQRDPFDPMEKAFHDLGKP